MTLPLLFVTALALVDDQKRVLLTRRPKGKDMEGLWEFPGGKKEEGELPEESLIREIAEELAITIKKEDLSALSFASHAYEKFHLFMPLYLCRAWKGIITPQEGQDYVWAETHMIQHYPMPPADHPLAAFLEHFLRMMD